ncbi:MAG: universal stress protein [Chloroflexia bacterium]|nr:universal stress protein [Chloroflexia bacterium]
MIQRSLIMFKKILLATDGSAPSERATDIAASLALRYRSEILVLHALTRIPDSLGEPNYSRTLSHMLEHARSLVANVESRLRELGVDRVDTDVIEGGAADVILDVVHTRNPDLLVIGARGLSQWKGLMLGSVSMAVTHRAPCPVMVVK